MQIYEFLSKSQHCQTFPFDFCDVCLYANIRIFKQITTNSRFHFINVGMFVSMQIYEFLSKSQRRSCRKGRITDVCLYANIRIFKQITT